MPNELYHHGILGQRWGVRNGPPYPLGNSDHSASERKAGWKMSLDKTKKERYNGSRKITDKHKRTAKTITERRINKGKKFVKNYFRKILKFGAAEFADIPGLNKKTREILLKEDLQKVNPGYRHSEGSRNNCTHCVIATEFRRRGYDVAATEYENPDGKPFIMFDRYFKAFAPYTKKSSKSADESDIEFKQRVIKELGDELKKFGNGARGVIGVRLKDNGGHVLNWEVSENAVKLYDGQYGNPNASAILLSDKITVNKFLYARLDDLDIKPEYLNEVVKNLP